MSTGKAVVYAGNRHYGDKIAKAIDEISEATNAALLKELEATRAELEVDKAALKDMTEKRDKTTTELCAWVSAARHGLIYGDGMIEVESPEDLEKRIDHLTDQIRIRAESLEEVQAELAAERAKPRGGVAWAAKHKETGELHRSVFSQVLLVFESKAACEQFISSSWKLDEWEVVPYPLGDGADELKAAIERAEKAEARVAAQEALLESANNTYEEWVKAANATTEGVIWIQSPYELAAHLKVLETKYATLKAAPAEVPPLDRWRVLATVAEMAYKAADFDFAKAVCLQMSVAEWKESKPYPLKD